MKFSIVLFWSLLAWPLVTVAQFQLSDLIDPETQGVSADSLAEMDRYFHQLVEDGRLAGIQTVVLRKGRLLHFDSYGYADLQAQRPLDEQSIFRIFSMTKPIVSVALMQLYEQGKFSLDDPLHKHLPEFEQLYLLQDSSLVPAQNPIRIVDLLRHTSGYSYGRNRNPQLDRYYQEADLHASRTNEEFVRKLSKIPLAFEPGTDWQYGLSTNICGYLVEVLSGQPLDRYLQDHILSPLGMEDTHFQVPPGKQERFTVGYGWSDTDELYIAEPAEDNRYVNEVTLFNGGGGLVSTTFDYLRFCRMLLNKGKHNATRILKPETIDLMLRDHLSSVRAHQLEPPRLPAGEAGFGLGFAVRGENPEALEQVFGWGGAVGTYFKVNLELDLAYVLMIQLSPYRQLGLRQTFQDFVEGAIK